MRFTKYPKLKFEKALKFSKTTKGENKKTEKTKIKKRIFRFVGDQSKTEFQFVLFCMQNLLLLSLYLSYSFGFAPIGGAAKISESFKIFIFVSSEIKAKPTFNLFWFVCKTDYF